MCSEAAPCSQTGSSMTRSCVSSPSLSARVHRLDDLHTPPTFTAITNRRSSVADRSDEVLDDALMRQRIGDYCGVRRFTEEECPLGADDLHTPWLPGVRRGRRLNG